MHKLSSSILFNNSEEHDEEISNIKINLEKISK